MSNLPPGAANDPNAPWNRDYPEPDDFCPHCDEGLLRDQMEVNVIKVDRWLFVTHFVCPACGEVMHAKGRDELEDYLGFWRRMPKEARETESNPKDVLEELAYAMRRL